MSEFQKNIIERHLKEKKKTKRELSVLLGIKENSVNRTISNPNISIPKLGILAKLLEVDLTEILTDIGRSLQDSGAEYHRINPLDASNQITINSLSEALNRSTKTVEQLVQIIAEHYPEKKEPI